MFLLVGLGNIGREYEETRHNCGFMCVDKIIEKYNISSHQTKFKADLFFGKMFNEDVIIVKPQTYMNRSGVAVSEVKKFYKIPIENIFVFHDDLDLEFCKLKYKVGGGTGGHNGLKSIDEMIGKNYHRIRIGIGRPENKEDTINYVLKRFNGVELKELDKVFSCVCESVNELFSEKKDSFLNKFYLLRSTMN
ncbi:MAG: aminoacyl-tRNA hydrolase [Rickettsiales bacterium]|nr:aminoacyl-tRNA hydrolase [Rickettsiales bacterium]